MECVYGHKSLIALILALICFLTTSISVLVLSVPREALRAALASNSLSTLDTYFLLVFDFTIKSSYQLPYVKRASLIPQQFR